MAAALALPLGLGFGIGALLGLLGGGGSILTVPALVYLLGQTPQAAVTTSLLIVGLNSALGALFHRSQGTLNWRVALVFGGAGMGAAYLAAGIGRGLPPALLMTAFAGLMLVVGLLMLARPEPQRAAASPVVAWKVVAGGAAVGALTGVLGVGGGFLIVPALVMLVGLPMREAIGTSLAVIALNSAAGFLGHLGGTPLDLALVLVFAVAGLAGAFAGARAAGRVDPELLRRAFALLVLALAALLLADNLPDLLALAIA